MISRSFLLRSSAGIVFFVACLLAPSAAWPVSSPQSVAPDSTLNATGYLEKVGSMVRMQDIVGLAALTPPPGDDPMTTQIDQWRKEYVQVMQQQAADAQKLFTKASQAAQGSIKKNDYIGAAGELYAAYEAAPDQSAFLQLFWVKDITDKIAAQAASDDANQHWLEEFELYDTLNSIYSISMRFHDQLQQITSRITMLSTYTPSQLYAMQESFDQSVSQTTQPSTQPSAVHPGNKPPTSQPSATIGASHVPLNYQDAFHPQMPNFPTWQTTLEGIREDMMFEALEQTFDYYVKAISYNKLATGGLTALRLLVNTPTLADSFSGLNDPVQRAQFLAEIDNQTAVAESSTPMNSNDLIDMWTSLVRSDMQTVNIPVIVLVKEFTDGAMSELDPFSEVFWPSELAEFMKQIQGSFSGVGIQIEIRNGWLSVVTPLSGSPAYEAGIQPGDIIATVDGKSTLGITVDQAVDEITGKSGTMVTLGIRRGTNPNLIIMPLKRAEIHEVSITGISRDPSTNDWNYMIDPQYGIAYIHIIQFQGDTADELLSVLDVLMQQHVRGIIIDLRDNPGGLLETCIRICDMFLTEGTIVSTRGRSDPLDVQSADGAPVLPPDIPMILLINQNSASASEIFSGAMHDLHRALIVGHQSFGKGLVQNQIFLDDDQTAMMKLTMANYYLPNGESIQRQPYAVKWGVQPDVRVPFSPGQLDRLEITWLANDIIPGKNTAPTTRPATQPTGPGGEETFDTQLDTALMLMRLQLVQTDSN
ncbi:MAG TPA: S41 family peptidase [Phycisphaerae bacterium]|nr:S41 family peptidase [Phycisphaerae bacterium]